jgi:hypothetical protein
VQTLTLKVPDDLADQLNRRARDLNRPKSSPDASTARFAKGGRSQAGGKT